jgi:hypothetical protein
MPSQQYAAPERRPTRTVVITTTRRDPDAGVP